MTDDTDDVATPFELSLDQNAALDSFVQFLLNPNQPIWVLEGYSGTGKSTLVDTLMQRLPSYIQSAKLLDPDYDNMPIQLTATTNKAAENFSLITGMDVSTIHSFLSLRVDRDQLTGRTGLVAARNAEIKTRYLVFIDEASMIDRELLTLIFQQTRDCKIVFIGDPAQLPPVKSATTPVFDAKFPTARLTQVMRQLGPDGKPANNPITELATAFRHTVKTGEWPQGFKPDGESVIWVDRPEFGRRIEAEFSRDDWLYRDSKILAWRNEIVIQYNGYVRELRQGDPEIQVGDYVEQNSFVANGKSSIKTDQTVYVSEIGELTEEQGVLGNWVVLDGKGEWFHPKHRADKQKVLNAARAREDFQAIRTIEAWVDLRAVFAQTINKSQGSTYNQVFIDLDDIKRCTNGNLIARLLYVAISRARTRVTLAGDLV